MARYIQGVREGLDTTVSRSQEGQSNIKFDFNNVVIHGKGFSIISALDCVLGKTTFERAYRRCLQEYAGRRLGVHEFQAVCEQESGQDLDWFFDQWVNSNKYLSYEIASKACTKTGDVYISEVEVRCLGTLEMPVPTAADFEDGTTQRACTNRLRKTTTIRFESRAPLKDVRLDPNNALAMVVPPPAPSNRQLSDMIRELPWVGAGEKALEVFENARRSEMSDADAWFKLGMTLYDGKYYEPALEAFRKARPSPSRGCAALVWQGHLLDLLERRDEALKCYREALPLSDDLNMRHDQYRMKLDRAWVERRLQEPFRRK
jgi:tetratricopeptide (TPR) repeat protein